MTGETARCPNCDAYNVKSWTYKPDHKAGTWRVIDCNECGETFETPVTTTMTEQEKIELKDVRKDLMWSDPSEYKHRRIWYKRDKIRELKNLGYMEVAGVDLRNPEDLDEETLDEDFWRKKTRDLWERESPETEQEIFEWYGAHREYIVENMIRQAEVVDDIRQCYRWLRETDAETVLDYGGGAGDFGLYLAQQGYNVAYADVQGSFPQFVRRRIRERPYVDLVVNRITSPDDTPSDVISSTDAAICLEVIEHLPDPESVIDGFADVINSGGYLISSWTFNDWSDDPDDVYTPCHINTGRDRSREVREYLELYFDEIDHTWNAQMRLWERK